MNKVIVFNNESSQRPWARKTRFLQERLDDFAEQHKIINISVVSQEDDLLQAFVLYEEQEE